MFLLARHLRMAHKFLVIGLLTVLMLTVPLFIYVKARLADIDAAQQELAGMAPLKALIHLTRLTQEHRELPGTTPLAQRQAKQAELSQSIKEVQDLLKAVDDKGLNQSLAKISNDWAALLTAMEQASFSASDSFTRQSQLVASELDTMEDLVNFSGIALDPSAANYFLQVAVLDHMPRLAESLAQLRMLGAAALDKSSTEPQDLARLAALASAVENSMRKVSKYVDLAGAADAHLKDTLAQPLAHATERTSQGIGLVRGNAMLTTPPNTSSASFVTSLNDTMNAQQSLMDASFDSLQQQLQDVVTTSQQTLYYSLLFVALCYGATTWLMFAVTRTTLASVRHALKLAQAVADGDLSPSSEPSNRDELGQLLRTLVSMQRKLSLVVRTVRSDADEVANASAQIAQGHSEISGRTDGQASSLEQTTASMRALGVTVSQNAESARQANQLAQEASNIAIRGGRVVHEVVQTMRGISDSSTRISDIIGVIDSIAFQTNILALNAAVEAARAGEQGRGFAVVATEVRALAGRSAAAAKEIKSLIGESVGRVEHGTALVDQAGSTMQEVVGAIQQVTLLMGEISLASVAQNTSVHQVCSTVEHMDQTLQENSARVAQMAKAAEALKLRAQDLVQVVARFHLDPQDHVYPLPLN